MNIDDGEKEICYTICVSRFKREDFFTEEGAAIVKKILPAIIAIVCIILLGILFVLTDRYRPTNEKTDLYKQLNVTGEEQVAVIIGDQLSEEPAVLRDGEVYIPLDDCKELINDRFYKGKKEDYILYSEPEHTLCIPKDSNTYGVYGQEMTENIDYTIWYEENDTVYLALKFIEKFTALQHTFWEKPNRVVITYQDATFNYCTVTKKTTAVRVRGGIKSPILAEVKKGQKLYVFEQMDEWSCVMTEDGLKGYIQNKYIEVTGEETIHFDYEEPVYASQIRDYKINMAWHQVTSPDGNASLGDMIANAKGLNVISPTWFDVIDDEGTIQSIGSSDYVNTAHNAGLEVWGLVGNLNYDVKIEKILASTEIRVSMVNQLMSYAEQYSLDGINLDFETLPVECKEGYIQFVRELSIACRQRGLVLSVDNYVPTDYTAFYNRKEQGIFADYIIIMGYDEHYAGSEQAGSVASIGFERTGIEKTLEEVPANKVISGIPFYTRLWAETPKTEEQLAEENDNEEYIPYTLSSDAIGMKKAESLLTAEDGSQIEPVWNEETAQYYAEFTREGVTYKIWLEDVRSLEEKMKLVKEYNLAGVSAWKLGLEKSEVWDVIWEGLE